MNILKIKINNTNQVVAYVLVKKSGPITGISESIGISFGIKPLVILIFPLPVIFLAKKTGFPIIPVGCALSHKIKVGSWDKMRVPLPFGKAAFTYGKAVWVKSEADFEKSAKELQAQLNWASEQSEFFINKKHFDTTQG